MLTSCLHYCMKNLLFKIQGSDIIYVSINKHCEGTTPSTTGGIKLINKPDSVFHKDKSLKRPLKSLKQSEDNQVSDIKDGAQISHTCDSDAAQIMRRASIEYYPLHKPGIPGIKDASGKIFDTIKPGIVLKSTRKHANAPTVLEMKNSDKILAKDLVNEDGIDVGPFEAKVKEELGENVKIQNDWDIDRLKGRVPSLTELQDVFQSAAKDPDVPWEYLPDGCYARSHITCKKLLNKGINCAKMYVIIQDDNSSPWGLFPPWRLKAENKFTKGAWWYHVATLAFAKDEKSGKVDGYVLDAAVNPKRPIKAPEWIKAFWSGDFPINFDVTHADVYDPPQQSYFDYQPKEFSMERFERCMPLSIKTNKKYKDVLKRIKEQYYEEHPDEKPDNWDKQDLAELI